MNKLLFLALLLLISFFNDILCVNISFFNMQNKAQNAKIQKNNIANAKQKTDQNTKNQDKEQKLALSYNLKKEKTLPFLKLENSLLVNEQGNEIMLRGVHYPSLALTINKKAYDIIKSKGINPYRINKEILNNWFSDYDLNQLKAIGANVVRIDLRLWQAETSANVFNEDFFITLDNTINTFTKNGIYVVLDLHECGQNSLNHNKVYGNVIWNDESLKKRVFNFWSKVADRYKDDPGIAAYDLMNEPESPSIGELHDLYQKIIEEIRKKDKKHIIVLQYDFKEHLKTRFGGPYYDDNILYSIHFYQPVKFTRQGGKKQPTIGLSYPGKYWDRRVEKMVLWDKAYITAYFEEVLKIVKEIGGGPLFVGEFGATVWFGESDALKWIEDMMDIFNKKKIHFTYFNYKSLARPKANSAIYLPKDKETVEAIRNILKMDDNIVKNIGLGKSDKNILNVFKTKYFESPPGLIDKLKEGMTQNLFENCQSTRAQRSN